MAYTGAGKTDLSIDIFDKLIASEENPIYYYGRSMAKFKSGNKASGFVDLDRAIALAPQNQNFKSMRSKIAAGMMVE